MCTRTRTTSRWVREQRARLNEMALWAGNPERLREMGNEMRDD
jgi:hypothetical protein